MPGTCPGELALRLRIYRGVLLGHVRRNGAGRPDQSPFRVIFSASELFDLGVAMTGPTQTV